MIPASIASMMLNSSVSLNAYTTAYLAEMDSQPTADQITLIDDLIIRVNDDGCWSKLDHLYLFAMHADQPSRVNVVDPTVDVLSKVGSPTFVANSHWQGGASAYLQTATDMDDFSLFAQNSNHLGIWVETSVWNNVGIIGNASNSNEIRSNGYAMAQASYVYGEAYRAGMDSVTGHKVVTRQTSTSYKHFKDGVQQGATNSRASNAVAAATLKFGGGINGTGTSSFSIGHCGLELDNGDSALLYDIFNDYLTGVAAL